MKCFVISPIGEEGSEIRKRADQVYKYIISPVCEECGFEAIRVDKVNQSDSITQTIIDYIKESELVIADITGHNPNAFYEMGYRASIGKPMIHLKEKSEKIPFDIAGIRAFDYELSDLDSVAEVKARLTKTIGTMSFELDDIENKKELQGQDIVRNDNTQLLSVLYEIQDEIAGLRSEIHNKDTETIQAIVKASVPAAPIEDPNMTMMQALLPELLKNPNSMKTLMELGKAVEKDKK